MSITRFVPVLQLDTPTAASGKIWPKTEVQATINNLSYPVPGMIGMPTNMGDLTNIPAHLKTHEFHDLYITGDTLYGEVEITSQSLCDYVSSTEGTTLEALFRVAALTSITHDALGTPVVTRIELHQINALPGERLVTGE